MISKETLWCSSITGVAYTSYEDAVAAEKQHSEDVDRIASICKYMSAMSKVEVNYQDSIERLNNQYAALTKSRDAAIKRLAERISDTAESSEDIRIAIEVINDNKDADLDIDPVSHDLTRLRDASSKTRAHIKSRRRPAAKCNHKCNHDPCNHCKPTRKSGDINENC